MRSITIAKLVTVGSEVIELNCSPLTGIATPACGENGTAAVGFSGGFIRFARKTPYF
jgi:hypothetical protein